MNKFLNHHGLFFRYHLPIFPLFLLSSHTLKKFNTILISFFILTICSSAISQVDTIYGYGYAKNIGDPFNVALLARHRALSNALEKYRIKITSTLVLSKENDIDKLNETIVSETEGIIEKWSEVKVTEKDGFIKSVVEVIILNENEIVKQSKVSEIEQLLKDNKNINIEKRIKNLLKAYSIVESENICSVSSNKILNKLEHLLSNLKILRVNNNNNLNSFRVYEYDKKLTAINLNRIPNFENNSLKKSFYIMIDFGVLNYELIKLGLKIPSIKVNV